MLFYVANSGRGKIALDKIYLLLVLAVAVIGVYEAGFPAPGAVFATRFLALSGFILLCVTLALGPLAVLWPKKMGGLIKQRKTIGIASVAFVLIHVITILAINSDWDLRIAVAQTPTAVAVPAIIILLVVAVTSANYFVEKLGASLWKNVQRLIYFAFALSFAHFLFKARGLLMQAGDSAFVDWAEAFAFVMGVATTLLQASAFAKRASKKR